MKWLLLLGAAGAGGYFLLRPQPGFCIETVAKDNPKNRCVVSCFDKRLAAKRELTQIWKPLPNLNSRVFESKNTLMERRCG